MQSLVNDHGLSRRHPCKASGIARSTLGYRAVPRDDVGVIDFVNQHIARNPRHGFGLVYDSARHQGQPWGKTVLWRVHCQLKLNLPRRGKKRLPARVKLSLDQDQEPISTGAATSWPTPCGTDDASAPSSEHRRREALASVHG